MGMHRAASALSSRGLSRVTKTSVAAGLVAMAVAFGGVAVPAHAEEFDDLIKEMEDISGKATAKVEEIKEIEDNIAKGEREVKALKKTAEDAQRTARKASKAQHRTQGDVDYQARVQYRNLSSDANVNALKSANPQEAIDRSAYLGSLSRSAQRTLDESQKLNQVAAQRATDANIAVAVANYRQSELEGQRKKLERERRELDGQVKDVEKRVDAFTPEQRSRWESKNGPVALDVPPSANANGVVGAALSKIGSPYGWGAAGPNQFDCSGLMYWAYQQNGKSIPRTSSAQLAGGTSVPLSELQPGDIIGYYPGVTHVGMYVGNGQVVHASDYGIPVQVVPMNSMPVQGAVRY
ncbi:C40 family peptidase [Corynebacterium appendicis]|uniref:C40 family peptidase n=1 Tax=Corynebacterium appendicis TaxID=163202 RepID=UPI0035CD1219